MNKCVFYGTICKKELLQVSRDQVWDDASSRAKVKKLNLQEFDSEPTYKILLQLKIGNRRTTKTKTKKIEYQFLDFEAWGKAALTIQANAECGDKMLVLDSTARVESDMINSRVCFRINEFKLL